MNFTILKAGEATLNRIKTTNILILVIVPIGYVVIMAARWIFYGNLSVFAISIFYGIWFALIILLNVHHYRIYKKMPAIGNIKVASNGIQKVIGHLESQTMFDEIKELIAEPHTRNSFLYGHNEGSQSYLITFVLKCDKREQILISANSASTPQANFLKIIGNIQKRGIAKFKLTEKKSVWNNI